LEEAAEKQRGFTERFDAHVQAMVQAVEGNYNWRAVNMLSALVEFYEFVHAKEWLADALAADSVCVGVGRGKGPAVTAAVQTRRSQCKERASALAKDIVNTVGVAREQTYLHDLFYGLHRIFDVVLHPLMAGMQGVEHVNKQMKLTLTSQCTAANNNRKRADGSRMIGDVAQVAHAKVVRTHVIETQGASLPQNVYSQMLMGNLNWGSRESHKRTEKRTHKVFIAGSAKGLQALRDGTYASSPPAATESPVHMSALLSDPPRKKRFAIRGTPLRPDFLEPEPCVQEK
jgi:hypothetical protein